jgi:hypothetical protein
MRRRAFIAGLGSAAVRPFAPHAQQPEPIGRVSKAGSGLSSSVLFGGLI